MHLKRYLTAGVIVFAGLTAGLADSAAAELSIAEAINKAGRQRMLTQRISKTFCQLGIGLANEASARQLTEAIALFETQLAELRQFKAHAKVGTALASVASSWPIFRDLALSAPSPASARRLLDLDEILLAQSDHVVRVLENLSGITSSRLVNIAGRQRMLSQRIAKFYMARAWDVATPADHSEMDQAQSEFSGGLEALRDAIDNTQLIGEKLRDAHLQWLWLRGALEFTDGSDYPLIVLDASEKMLEVMETLTTLYEEIADL